MMNKWISTEKRLPPKGEYVLCHIPEPRCEENNDPSYVVCKLVFDTAVGPVNNHRSYYWETFGADVHDGQDVDYWMPIPALDKKGD